LLSNGDNVLQDGVFQLLVLSSLGKVACDAFLLEPRGDDLDVRHDDRNDCGVEARAVDPYLPNERAARKDIFQLW
jgi:hypothetical protein